MVDLSFLTLIWPSDEEKAQQLISAKEIYKKKLSRIWGGIYYKTEWRRMGIESSDYFIRVKIIERLSEDKELNSAKFKEWITREFMCVSEFGDVSKKIYNNASAIKDYIEGRKDTIDEILEMRD